MDNWVTLSTQPAKKRWASLQAQARAASKAAWEYARDHTPGREIAQAHFTWRPGWDHLKCDVGADSYHGGVFFAVDRNADPDVAVNRLKLEYQRKKDKYLFLGVPESSRERLGQREHRLRVFQTDSQELLARRWYEAIETLDHGPQVADLWSPTRIDLQPWSPDYLKDRALNPGQQVALAAMTTPGGHFVWGPPGTGKTTVITSAVKDALDHGRTVLITSHTHVAVDNVLTSLLADDERYGLQLFQLGRVIRKKPGDETKVAPQVAQHPFLLDDKAAALLVDKEDRRAQLAAQEQANLAHEDRTREHDAQDRVHRLDIDDKGIRLLDKQRDAFERWRKLDQARQEQEKTVAALDQRLDEATGQLAQYETLDQEMSIAHNRLAEADDARNSWSRQANELEAACRQVAAEQADREQRILALRRPSVLPWVKRSRQGELSAVLAQHSESLHSAEQLLSQASYARTTAQQWDARYAAAYDSLIGLQARQNSRGALARKLTGLRSERDRAAAEHDQAENRCAEMLRILGDEPASWQRRYRAACDDGSMELIHQWDVYVQRVKTLDKELADIQRQKSQLEDEYQKTRRTLLAQGGAPVIATTLDSLVFTDELTQRRFDVVIIDEVASAESAKVVYAAAKADQTCALVGDFLQNAPVADAEDPTTEQDSQTAAWQTQDIFSLAGITDRASAARHPHCVALSRQYRFPPIVAETVNAFCYDGLLESAKATPEGTVVTFHDTSGLRDLLFERINRSWWCRASAELAVAVASTLTGSIGFVTPYKPQEELAHRLFASLTKRGGPSVECGTAHAFQGREMDAIILDLMQDGEPRWVSAADIHGNERARSAAKLLNVALTRTKDRLHIIGDWEFIRRSDSLGMKALADLQYAAGFELVRHS